jgi:indole-3-glycerol phosphate synthase
VSAILERIVAAHRRAAAADTRTLDQLERVALAAAPVRPFRDALAAPGLSVIAEIKRRSPSKGDLAPDLVPAVVAKAYADGGADCLSVLTDRDFFGAQEDDLAEARAAAPDVPVLRKDFTVCEADIYDARAMGADAVLLIVAALVEGELTKFRQLANELDMAALVEVHDDHELELALDAGSKVIGVNQRDLRTFEVDTGLAQCLAERIPPGVVKVAESGIKNHRDADMLHTFGYDAVLVGESLVTAPDPAKAVRALKLKSG